MTTLTEFLLARIAEDERRASAVEPLGSSVDWGEQLHPDFWIHQHGSITSTGYLTVKYENRSDVSTETRAKARAVSDHFDAWSPPRVLAECAAKRRIVAMEGQLCYGDESDAGFDVLALLALPYADHPDYDEAWRP